MTGPTFSRRAFLGALLATGACAGLSLNDTTTYDLILERYTFESPLIPEAFDSYRIVFLSDLHLGPFVPLTWIQENVERAMEFDPQLLILGGDLVDAPKSTLSKMIARIDGNPYSSPDKRTYGDYSYQEIAEFFSSLAPRDGIIMVPGNHDRWFPENVWMTPLENVGIKILCNSEYTIVRGQERLSIFGADDYTTGFPSAPPEHRPQPSSCKILLAHNPDYVRLLVSCNHMLKGFIGGLFGHTHGGQIQLPLLGALTYNIQQAQFGSGEHLYHDVPLYTSRGMGVVELPIRIGCPPEITLIELKKSQE